MRNLTEQNITEAALERLAKSPNPRAREIVTALIRHLHDFARDVRLTPDEWKTGIDFLTDAGHITDDKRQEFILLSDTLGLSALVDLIANGDKPEGATESSLLGPFYREGAPEKPMGADIAGDTAGERVTVRGVVKSCESKPIAGAVLDVWQAAPNGMYDVQDPRQGGMNLRGKFRTRADGKFEFLTIKPASYPVPDDGPVGKMLRATGRHPFRPAHIHFIVSAPRYKTLITALYLDGDDYLDSDAVFGSRGALVVKCDAAKGRSASIEFDFVLTGSPGTARSG